MGFDKLHNVVIEPAHPYRPGVYPVGNHILEGDIHVPGLSGKPSMESLNRGKVHRRPLLAILAALYDPLRLRGAFVYSECERPILELGVYYVFRGGSPQPRRTFCIDPAPPDALPGPFGNLAINTPFGEKLFNHLNPGLALFSKSSELVNQ